jgi:hypothetical protein
MTVPVDKALLALQLLIEGTSIRSTERITGIHRDTILRLPVLVGEKCEGLMARVIVNVPVKDVQADEMGGASRRRKVTNARRKSGTKLSVTPIVSSPWSAARS